MKPFNDAEFVKRAAGRGPKAFLWSYDDDKAWVYGNECMNDLDICT